MTLWRPETPLVGAESSAHGSDDGLGGGEGAPGPNMAIVASGIASGGAGAAVSGGGGGLAPKLAMTGSTRRMMRFETIRSAGMFTPTPERTPMSAAVILRM
jgi:hypothetical protein